MGVDVFERGMGSGVAVLCLTSYEASWSTAEPKPNLVCDPGSRVGLKVVGQRSEGHGVFIIWSQRTGTSTSPPSLQPPRVSAQPFVPVQSDTAVQAKLHRDSWGHPPSGCSGPSCYWRPEGLGTEHDPPSSHPGTGHNAPLHPQLPAR
ncbi:hypothetical protein PAMA_021828 [Pampus argenteus]